MIDETVAVLTNRKITPRLYVLAFESAALARLLKPGHFLQVAVAPSYDPFLRRPFTIYRVRGRRVEILYEVVGAGSKILTRRKEGQTIRVMGPLGNTFRMNLKNRVHVVVGGGVGIAPFIFLGQKIRIDHFLMGARSRDGLLPKSEIGPLWKKSRFATEDGSCGEQGYVTRCLDELIRETKDPRKLYLYICGPKPMMRAVMEIARRHHLEGEASVDERMACGVGACLGCVVQTRDGYKTACTDGTVFTFDRLLL
jgi:dihydroorotate dehydrogenase electron transfer subunit